MSKNPEEASLIAKISKECGGRAFVRIVDGKRFVLCKETDFGEFCGYRSYTAEGEFVAGGLGYDDALLACHFHAIGDEKSLIHFF